MGNCCGGSISQDELRNRAIEAAMRKDKAKEDSKIKLLLLGAGESGKSTFFKQMKLLYSNTKSFSPSELSDYRKVIAKNIWDNMTVIIAAAERKGLVDDEETKANIKTFTNMNREKIISPELGELLNEIWASEAIKKAWDSRSDTQVQDALEYYMQDETIKRVATGDAYKPSNLDILRSRVRTSGVVTEKFRLGEATFEIYDVGGQRNERRKWINCFDGVTSIIFMAAISEYDQLLYEDNSQSRQLEAIELFGSVLRNEFFKKHSFILFLNKYDLFREKLAHIPFKVEGIRNEDYDGKVIDESTKYATDGSDDKFEEIVENTREYLLDLYLQQDKGLKHNIYPHFTNSIDTQNIQIIMNSCKDIILRATLIDSGWYTVE